MKYLIVLGIVLLAYFLWRNARRAERQEAKPPPAGQPALPEDMVRCPVCQVHLPRADALPGSSGLMYCSQEHRLRDES